MLLKLTDSFLSQDKRATSAYLLAIYNELYGLHSHDEAAASQILSAQVPATLTASHFGQKAVTTAKSGPSFSTVSTSTTLTVPVGTSVDPTLTFTTPADAFSRLLVVGVKFEKIVHATPGGRTLRIGFKIGGTARNWFTRQADVSNIGTSHHEFIVITTGAITVEVEYVASNTGYTLEGDRTLHGILFGTATL